MLLNPSTTCFKCPSLHHAQIHKAKAEKQRARVIKDEMDAKRAKTKAARERKQERLTQKRQALTADDEEKK